MDFKLKYAGSALGYVWSVVKPLSLFTMLYLVFGRIFGLDSISAVLPARAADRDRALYFLQRGDHARHGIGRGARGTRCASCRSRGSSSRRRAPSAVGITLAVNLTVVAGFVVWNGITPRWNWILLLPPPRGTVCVHAWRRARPGDDLRAASRHRPGLGALRATALLRDSDHLPDRLPTAVGPAPSSSSIRSRRCCRTCEQSCSTRTCPRTRSRPPRYSMATAGACSRSRSRSESFSGTPRLPARGPVVRGTRMTTARRRGRRYLEVVPAAAPAANDDQGTLPAPIPTRRRTRPSERSTTSPSRSSGASSSASSARTGAARARC